MSRRQPPAEWSRLAHLYDEINESFVDYDRQAGFLLACRDRYVPWARLALDLGCGTGQHARRLAAAGLPTAGVDLSPRLLRQGLKARGKLPTWSACGDLAALPLAARFDLVYALNFVFSFLHTSRSVLSALAETRRVLSPRGVLVMDYHVFFPPTGDDPLKRTWRERCRVRGQTLTVTHRPVVDWVTQLSSDRMTHRFTQGGRLVREIESTEVRRISLPQDLMCILQGCGLEVVRHCAWLDLDGEPDGRLGVFVARRRRPSKDRRAYAGSLEEVRHARCDTDGQ